MLLKAKTIKVRIAILSFFIMILTVMGIMLTEYVLQKTANSIIIVDMLNYQAEENRQDGYVEGDRYTVNTEESFMITKQNLETQQRIKFFWLVTISGCLLLIGMILIYQIIKKELIPLENLKNDMDQMDFTIHDQKLLVSKKDTEEISSLTNSYNRMIENLKESYELQKRFSQDVTHELRTPITIMKTSLQVHQMMKSQQKTTEKDLLTVLEEQVTRMEKLINGLLSLVNKRKLNEEKIEVRSIIEEIILFFQPQIHQKKIKVSIQGNLILETDADLLSMMLKNIIDNAIRYNKVNGSIDIKLDPDIRIIDTGIGIPKEQQERIFSPFYCVDESRSKTLGGLGLGLAIVKDSIHKLGFKLTMSSQLDEGTTFKVIPNRKS